MQLDRPLAVVTPTADGDVLTALARVDASLSVSQLRRVIGRFSGEGLRKVLGRLVAQGIVDAEYAGNGVAYRLNRDHLAAAGIVALADARSRLLDRIEQAFESWPACVRYGVVFGSASRGEMHPASDIDLLIVHDDDASYPLWEDQSIDLQVLVRKWTGNSLSLISMPVSELRLRSDEPLIQNVLRDGLTVAGSRAWFQRQVRSGGTHAHTGV